MCSAKVTLTTNKQNIASIFAPYQTIYETSTQPTNFPQQINIQFKVYFRAILLNL